MAKSVPAPMEALLAAELPEGDGWQYEPKWDGFRCLARREGDEVTLTSKSGKPLARYFPEIAAMLRHLGPKRFLLDGELIIPVGDALSFDALQLRLHPAESRVRKLAAATPAEMMAFDLLELDGQGQAAQNGLAVHQYRARAALAQLTAMLRSRQAEIFAQDFEQGLMRRERDFRGLAIKREQNMCFGVRRIRHGYEVNSVAT